MSKLVSGKDHLSAGLQLLPASLFLAFTDRAGLSHCKHRMLEAGLLSTPIALPPSCQSMGSLRTTFESIATALLARESLHFEPLMKASRHARQLAMFGDFMSTLQGTIPHTID